MDGREQGGLLYSAPPSDEEGKWAMSLSEFVR